MTEAGKSPISYAFDVTVAAPPDDTADMTFDLTTPSKNESNTISGGGSNRTVTVNVQNGTGSVVLTGTKTSAQEVKVGGTNASDVSPAGSATAPTYTVNTSSVSAAGGSKSFTLTVSEDAHSTIVYNVTVTVASPPPATADVTFALTTPGSGGGNSLSGGGASKTVTVNVVNTTNSVVITATKTSGQTLSKGGTDQTNVTIGDNSTKPTITVDTTSVATDGGSKSFTIAVNEGSHASITYNITVTVAGGG